MCVELLYVGFILFFLYVGTCPPHPPAHRIVRTLIRNLIGIEVGSCCVVQRFCFVSGNRNLYVLVKLD